MINRNISVHLQDFPDTSFLKAEKDLVVNMDLVRNICSTALSIRDNKNLRVRLPLSSLTVIGKNADYILPFKDIIAEEVNVKEIKIEENIGDLAELKPQINFKKIGAKYGARMKEITGAVKSGNWKLNDKNEMEVLDIALIDDEFEMKLAIKDHNSKKFAILALPTNDYLVQLDIEITKELEEEGIARDIVRAIQQNRKDADLNVTDRINLRIHSDNPNILVVVENFESYIKEQVLADSIVKEESLENLKSSSQQVFETKLEEGLLMLSLS